MSSAEETSSSAPSPKVSAVCIMALLVLGGFLFQALFKHTDIGARHAAAENPVLSQMMMDNLGPKLSAEGLEWAGYPYDTSRETTTAKAHFKGDETIEVHFSSLGDAWKPSRFPYTIKRDGAKFTVSANIDQGTLSAADAYSIVALDMNEILQALQKQKSIRASWKVSKAEQK